MSSVSGKLWHPRAAVLIALVAAVGLGFGTGVLAQDEDLSDNEVCMDCHDDTDRAAPDPDSTRPQVHNPAGGFHVEDHDMWSCIDCHTYITEIPHADDVMDKEVNCTDCHEEDPVK